MPRKKEVRQAEHRFPLEEKRIEFLFGSAIRRLEVFLAAKPRIRPEMFHASERALAAVWTCAVRFYDEHGRLPNEEELRVETGDALLHDLDVDEQDETLIDAYLSTFFEIDEEQYVAKTAKKYLQRFLEDRFMEETRSEFSLERVPSNILSVISRISAKASEIRSVTADRVSVPFPDDWSLEEARVDVTPTGLSFLDYYLGGGHVPGELHLVLGPYASGKSMFTQQLAISAGLAANARWREAGCEGPQPISYIFTYEDPAKEIRLRMLANKAEIPLDTLIQGQPGLLSTTAELKDYEQQRYAQQVAAGQEVFGERERLNQAILLLNQIVRIVDLTGHDSDSPTAGCGLVDEISSILEQETSQPLPNGTLTRPGLVLVDFINAAIDKHVGYYGLNRDDKLSLYQQFPKSLKDRVLVPYKCPGWLLGQADTEGQKAGAGVIKTHMNAAECKSLGQYSNFCFNMTKKTVDEQLLAFSCSKARRQPEQRARVLFFNGNFASLEDVSAQYVMDDTARRIVSRDELNRVGGGSDRGEAVGTTQRTILPNASTRNAAQALRPRNQ